MSGPGPEWKPSPVTGGGPELVETGWVSFAQVKAGVGLRRVLEDYGVFKRLRRSGSNHYRGPCPIHQGEGRDAFHADFGKNVFHCFSCGAGGNVLDLVAHMEQCPLREAALRLQRRYLAAGCTAADWRQPPRRVQLVTKRKEANAPLSFCLSGLDAAHPYLLARNLSWNTAAHFGIGYYAGSGIMSGRLAIPIHDERGRLVAYAGRSVSGEDPRYRFPAGFRKAAALFNYHRAAALGGDSVVVVEGFFDSMRVHQAGFKSVVALMGAALSRDQESLLVQRFRRVSLMLDGDQAGRIGSQAAAQRLAGCCSVGHIMIPSGRQPDQMADHEIREILGHI
jgi:DNA primase